MRIKFNGLAVGFGGASKSFGSQAFPELFTGPEPSRAAGAFWGCCLTAVRTTDAIGQEQ
jgi:hypothetical protein